MVINSNRYRTNAILFVFYTVFIFVLTIGTRNIGVYNPRYNLFWSYREFLSGNLNIGKQIVENIILFLPLGFLLPNDKRYIFIPVIISIFVELIQYYTLRGYFEFDDILNNSIGTLIGWLIGRSFQNKRFIGIVCILSLSLVCILTPETKTPINFPRILCFQTDGKKGFVFCQRNISIYTLLLQNTQTGKIKKIKVNSGINRPDVADYFGNEYQYSGFTIDNNVDAEYEFLISYNALLTIPTGVYISPNGIHYVKETEFVKPNINVDFVDNGILRSYQPIYHCWVYQYDGALYWIVDHDFFFEDDGSTYIQYQLWTTQIDELPLNRLENGWDWDNIGDYFEENEIYGDYGEYRVMRRELPKEYPIISIETGYYRDGNWLWRMYFRPYYEFK